MALSWSKGDMQKKNEHRKMHQAKFKCRSLAAITALLMSATLIGCDHYGEHEPFLMTSDHETNHMIDVIKKNAGIKLSVRSGSIGLNGYQERKVKKFLAAYKADPQGPLTVAAPSGGANEQAIVRALSHIRDITRQYNIPTASLNLRSYYAEGQTRPAIRMYFEQNVAIPPECGNWSENLADDRENVPYPNFGCASQNNLAAMIANPRDLVEPRGSAPRSRPSARRDVMYDKFVKGESTAAQKTKDEKASTSDITKE